MPAAVNTTGSSRPADSANAVPDARDPTAAAAPPPYEESDAKRAGMRTETIRGDSKLDFSKEEKEFLEKNGDTIRLATSILLSDPLVSAAAAQDEDTVLEVLDEPDLSCFGLTPEPTSTSTALVKATAPGTTTLLSPSRLLRSLVSAALFVPLTALRLAKGAVEETHLLSNYAMHQASCATRSLATVLWTGGNGRKTWPLHLRIFIHWFRSQSLYKLGCIAKLRRVTGILERPTRILIWPGVQVTKVAFHVDRRHLLRFEREAELHLLRKTSGLVGFQHPIPREVDPSGKIIPDSEGYKLDGEWVELKPKKGEMPTVRASPAAIEEGTTDAPSEGPRKDKKVILYLHGGAYIVGTPSMFRIFTSRMAKETGRRLFVLNYRIAPEHPFPAALHDALAAYLWLTQPDHPTFASTPANSPVHAPIDPSDIILMGDSAGAGLCVALMSYLKDFLLDASGNPMLRLPAAACLLSPWVDMTFCSGSLNSNKDCDWIPADGLKDVHDFIIPPTAISDGVPHPARLYLLGNAGERHHDLYAIYDRLERGKAELEERQRNENVLPPSGKANKQPSTSDSDPVDMDTSSDDSMDDAPPRPT
ncbi:hypothetical protein HK101_004598, partial [Irineochytrium annulatum]